MIDLSKGQQFNCAAWVLYNNLVNEVGKPLNFNRHKFLVDFFMDESPEIVAEKSSQIGFSTTAILKSIHLAKYRKANIIYLLPSKAIVKEFVTPKFDPLVNTNSAIKNMMGTTDNLGLKSIGEGRDQRFIYFRSSWSEDAGIAISAHVLVADEYDRSNMKAVNTYHTRLDAAKLDRPDLGWDWRFSNPTFDGAGVDELYQKSDQKTWMLKCPHCNIWQTLTYPENINFKDETFICSKCFRILTDEDRRHGQWIKKYFGRNISGYRVNQLMANWISASKIIADSNGDQSIFHNFTLGLPYTSKDIKITREAIIKCIFPTQNPMTDVAMGVDNGVEKHYVIGNKYGVFAMGKTKDWQEIENLRNRYAAYMVCDANPYRTPVLKLVEKYRGKVFAHDYREDSKNLGTTRWAQGDDMGMVESDRTKLLDSVVADINSQDIYFNMTLTELENVEFISHCEKMYRIVEENAKGIKRGVWKTIGQEHGVKKPDHLFHSLCLFRVALQQTLSKGMIIKPAMPNRVASPVLQTNPDGTVNDGIDLRDIINSTKVQGGKNWVTK